MKTRNDNFKQYLINSLRIINEELNSINITDESSNKDREILIKKSKTFLNVVKDIEKINGELKQYKDEKEKVYDKILEIVNELELTTVDTISYVIKIINKTHQYPKWPEIYNIILNELITKYPDMTNELLNIKSNCDIKTDPDKLEKLNVTKNKLANESLVDVDTMIPNIDAETQQSSSYTKYKKQYQSISESLTKINTFINDLYLINQVLDNLLNMKEDDFEIEEFTADDILNEDIILSIRIKNDDIISKYADKNNVKSFDDYIEKDKSYSKNYYDDYDDHDDDDHDDDDHDDDDDNYNDGQVYEREFNAKERDKLAKEGKALPDGSFPIVTIQDLKNAIKTYGLAKNKSRAKRHIIKRAKELNAYDLIPDEWK